MPDNILSDPVALSALVVPDIQTISVISVHLDEVGYRNVEMLDECGCLLRLGLPNI